MIISLNQLIKCDLACKEDYFQANSIILSKSMNPSHDFYLIKFGIKNCTMLIC